MFKQFLFLLVIMAVCYSAPLTEQDAMNELKSAGMSENAVNSLIALDSEFKNEYPKVAGNKETSDKFIAEYSAKARRVVDSFSSADQAIYQNHLNKYNIN